MNARFRRVANKLRNEKSVFIFWAQGSSRIVHHTCGTIDKIFDTRCNVSWLSLKPWRIHFFSHPYFIAVVVRVPVFTILPIAPPAYISAIYNIHQPFTFTGMIAIVIFTDEIGVFIKNKFMCITITGSKYFKVASIGITSGNNTAIGVFPFFTSLVLATKTNITNLPINSSVRSHFHARHTVTTKSYMNSITMRNRSFIVSYPIAVFIFHSP